MMVPKEKGKHNFIKKYFGLGLGITLMNGTQGTTSGSSQRNYSWLALGPPGILRIKSR